MLPPAAMHLEQKESTEKMTGTQQYLHRNKYYHDDRHQHPGHPQKQQDYHRYRRHYRNDHHYHHHHHHYHHRHHHRYKHHQLSSQTDQQLQNGSRNSRNTDYRRTISPLSSSTISFNDNSSSIQHANMFVTGKIKNKSLIQSVYIET